MKTWYIRTWKKGSPDVVSEGSIDALTAEEAAKKIEGGPVRFFYKDGDYSEYVGSKYLYEVKELLGG